MGYSKMVFLKRSHHVPLSWNLSVATGSSDSPLLLPTTMDPEGHLVKDNSRPRRQCNAWRRGTCRFGDNCRFRHQPDEKGMLKNGKKDVPQAHKSENGSKAPLDTPRSGSSKWSTDITAGQTRDSIYTINNFPVNSVTCKDWRSGACTRGESCRFRHQDEAGNTSERAVQSKMQTNKQITGQEREHQEISIMVAEMRTRAERQAKEEKEKIREEMKRQAEEEKRLERERSQREEQRIHAEFIVRERERRAEEDRRRNAERLAREAAEKEASRIQQAAEIHARRVQETAVVEQYLVFGSSLVTCNAGLDIGCVVPGFDLCTVTIKNLPRDAKPEEIKDIFMQQGLKRSDFFLSNTKINANRLEATVLVNVEYGQLIATGLEGIPFRDEPLSFNLSDNANANSMDLSSRNQPFLLVTWRAPSDTLVATYSTMEQAQDWARKLDGTLWRGRQIKAVMNERPQSAAARRHFNPASIKIMNLPPNGYVDSELSGLTGSMRLRLLKSPRYDLEHSFITVRAHLLVLGGIRMDTYEVLSNGGQENAEAKIKVLFDNWENAQAAHARMGSIQGGPSSPNFRVWVPPKPLRYTIRIPKQQYDAQRKQWDSLSHKTPGSGAYVQCKVGNRGDVVFIDVLGQDKGALGPLKVRVESLVAGEKLGPGFWHQLMASNAAKPFFDQIYKETGVYVRNDFKTQSLNVYGESDKVQVARRRIKAEIDRLAQTETTRILERGSVRFFVKEGLGKLAELLGEDNVKLNLASRPCKITVKGGEEAIHHLQMLLEEARTTVFHDPGLTGTTQNGTCPICLDEASHPETLVCGHTYCGGCIKHFLISASDTKNFPLVCMGNDATCNTPISIPFIRKFLPLSLFQTLVESVFVSYLEEHPQELKYCTTPDCKQIYRRQASKTTLQCPSCFSNICPACGEEGHENMTCEERRIHKNPALQERLNDDFARASGFKRCPQCNIWIEKTEGCNHMSCRCGAHICWRCMAISDHNGTFDGRSIYAHMEANHGNIFDLPPEILRENEQAAAIIAEARRVQQQAELERVRVAQNARVLQAQRHRELERENERLAAARAQALRAHAIQQHAEIDLRRMAENARLLEEARRRERERQERIRADEARRAEDRGWCIIM